MAVRLIVGLGNPGPAYEGTRHNLGYLAVRRLAGDLGLPGFRPWKYGLATAASRSRRRRGVHGAPAAEDATVLLLPTTYMNESGTAVAAFLRGHVVGPSDLIVVHDDLDLPAGRLRLRLGGGSGGHRGVASILGELGREDFVRVKIGIGRPPAGVDPVDYVLERPSPVESEMLQDCAHRAAGVVLVVLREGLVEAMNRYNRDQDRTPADGTASC
jgi:PTH1 family peptidyl-tRNA hydrolase